MTKKKSHNPFKLWGSYVGAVSGGLLSYLSLKYFLYDFIDIVILVCRLINSRLSAEQCIEIILSGDLFPLIFMQYIIYIFFGFVIGWIIHGMFRMSRRKFRR
ncbi:MAG: hypothetical protein AABY22_03855 [Nanoarchaeota archaeon]